MFQHLKDFQKEDLNKYLEMTSRLAENEKDKELDSIIEPILNFYGKAEKHKP